MSGCTSLDIVRVLLTACATAAGGMTRLAPAALSESLMTTIFYC